MCVSVCEGVCESVYVNVHMLLYKQGYILVCLYVGMCVYMLCVFSKCVNVWVHLCVSVCMFVRACAFLCVCMCVFVRIVACASI